MIWLILGIALWWGAHLLKRVAPGARTAMTKRMGDASKGVIAGLLLLSVVLMVIGFRGAPYIEVYQPPAWTLHLNNLLMVVSVILFGVGSSKSPMRGWLRHPMLTGVAVWAVAHLLVNGDLYSVILFGTLGLWAVAEMLVINAREPVYHRFEGGTLGGSLRLLAISAVVFAVIAAVHTWLGYWPFAG